MYIKEVTSERIKRLLSKFLVLITHVSVKPSALHVQVQFQLNRMPLVEMHLALDLLPEISLVFPDLPQPESDLYPSIPWTPSRQWKDKLDNRCAHVHYNIPRVQAMDEWGRGRGVKLSKCQWYPSILWTPSREWKDKVDNRCAHLYVFC